MPVSQERSQYKFHLALIAGAGLLFAIPAFINVYLAGHDFFFHVMFSHHFTEQLRQGDLYPRWMQQMNAGFGSPIFFFYAPLPYYITSLLSLLLPGDLTGASALIFSATLALIASGITAYFWLREFTSSKFAMILAIVYMALPYHLAVDFYIRFAFAELWTFVWMPLILLLSLKINDGKLSSILWLALSLALLILTHLPTLIIFMPVFVGHFLFIPDKTKRKIVFAHHLIAIVLAFGMSAIYWLPAITTQEYINMKNMFVGMYHYTNNFLLTGPGYGHSTILWRYLTFITVLLSSLAYGAWLFSRMQTHLAIRRELNYWLVIVFLSFLMTMPVSSFIWEWIPVLQKLQFPWRFNTILTLAAVTVFALAVSEHEDIQFLLHGRKPIAIWLLLLGVLLGSELVYGFKPIFINRMGHENVTKYLVTSRSPLEYRPYWVPAERFSLGKIGAFAAATPQVKSDQTETSWQIKKWQPRSVVLAVNAVTESQLTLHHFYYPGWSGFIDSPATQLQVKPSATGLIQFPVPAGQHEVTLTLQPLPEERAGIAISFAAILVWLVLGIFRFVRRTS